MTIVAKIMEHKEHAGNTKFTMNGDIPNVVADEKTEKCHYYIVKLNQQK